MSTPVRTQSTPNPQNSGAPKASNWTATKATPNTAWTSSPTSPATTKQASTSYQLEYDDEDITSTTKRMLGLVQQTHDVADHTMREIDLQNEKIKQQQDEAAEIHDALNVSERKLRGIKSFWGNLSNAFKSDKKNEHQNQRQKYEKDMAKEKIKTAEDQAQQDDALMKQKLEAHKQDMKVYSESQQASMKQAQTDSKTQLKSGTAPQNSMAAGKFVFQERTDIHEKCEAERDLDQIGDYVTSLKEKAVILGDAAKESNKRLGDLTTEMDRANDRTKGLNQKADKFLKKS